MSDQNKTKRSGLSTAERIGLYLAVIGLVASSFFSAYSLHQNSQNLETASAALQMSVDPSIDIRLPENNGQEISIQNTSTVNLTDVRVFPVCYYIKKENESFKIIDRQPLTPVDLPSKTLKPKQRSSIRLEATSCSQLPKVSSDYVNGLVVIFHREIDNKRFVKIEPFVMSSTDPRPGWASSIYAEGGWSGDPSIIIGMINEIKKTETILFRAEELDIESK